MSKKPPNRRGISFEVGAQLEARDSLKNWYSASVEKIDYDEEKVLIHYRQWSHRYDEWFDWDSPYLRPVERVQLRKEGLQAEEGDPVSISYYVAFCYISEAVHILFKCDCKLYILTVHF
uniref:PHD finger protein 20-like protein 1 n=1 Tax=Erpetoichthys calabaricus TaxID=27687 RepID=A0A8C4TQI2_ERPCA